MSGTTTKFSQFQTGNNLKTSDTTVGLRGGLNTIFTNTGLQDSAGDQILTYGTNAGYGLTLEGTGGTILPRGSTADRPLVTRGAIRLNTTTGFFECSVDGVSWVDLSTGGGGTSVAGTANQIDVNTVGPVSTISLDAALILPGTLTTSHTVTLSGLTASTILGLDGSNNIISITEPLAPTLGGTGLSTYTLGDTLYASAASTLAKLAGNTTNTIKYLAQTGTGVVSAAPAWTTISGGDITGAALTEVNDTNVTMTLGGSPTTALLRATSMTLGWTGQLAVTRGGTGLSSVVQGDLLYGSAANTLSTLTKSTTGTQYLGNQGTSNNPAWATISGGDITGAALTKTDDTNVTLTLGGTPTTALLRAASITAGWTGTLAETRGGTNQSTYTLGDTLYASAANTLSKLAGNTAATIKYLSQTGTGAVSAAPVWSTISGGDITGAALTKTDDTNVTLTLGGTPTTALLRASSITAGWTGQLAVSRGGTGLASATAYAVLCGGTTSTNPFQSIASVGTSGQVLTSNGAGALPTFQSNPSGSGFSVVNIQTFVSSGTYTPTANMKYCIIETVGGGGGGGGGFSAASNYQVGGGGGGGGYSRKFASAATIGASQTVTIGAAGTAGSAGNNNGGNGGDTSVGSICIGKGGTGGNGSTTGGVTNTPGGAGGVAGTGDVSIPGQRGLAGSNNSSATLAGYLGNGGAAACGFGYGAQTATSSTPTAGVAGNVYGSGGSGGQSFGNGDVAGGAGAAGIVVITEFI